jgi:hypothetical protein
MATAVYDDDGSMVVGCESKYMLYQTYVDIVLDKQKFDLDVSNEKILAVAHELLDRNKFDPFLRKKYKRRVSSILNNSTLLANEIPVNVDINLYPEIADGCALVRAGVQIPAEKQRDFKYVFFKKNWTKLKSNPIHAASLLIFYAAREHHLLSLEKDDPLEYTHSFLRHIYQNRWDVGALRTYVELFVPRNSFFSSKNTLASEYIVFNKLRIDPAVSIQKIPVNPENHIESQKQKYYLSSLTLFGRQQIEAYGKNYMAEKDVQYFSNGSVKRFYVKNLYAKYVEMFEQSDGQKFGFNNYISFHENGNLAGVNLVKTPLKP